VHEAVPMKNRETFRDTREIAPKDDPVEGKLQGSNPIARRRSAESCMQCSCARLVEDAEGIGRLDHPDHPDDHVVGAGVARHPFDLKPLMAPNLA
jgi:hypothetical protein